MTTLVSSLLWWNEGQSWCFLEEKFTTFFWIINTSRLPRSLGLVPGFVWFATPVRCDERKVNVLVFLKKILQLCLAEELFKFASFAWSCSRFWWVSDPGSLWWKEVKILAFLNKRLQIFWKRNSSSLPQSLGLVPFRPGLSRRKPLLIKPHDLEIPILPVQSRRHAWRVWLGFTLCFAEPLVRLNNRHSKFKT